MLRLSGEERFDRSPENLWPALTNPEFLSRCFPGVDRIVRADDRSAAVVVRPGFSFIRGELEVAFEFVESEPPTQATVTIHVKGIGSSAELETRLHLVPMVGGTRVRWASEARQLGGLLKAVSQGLLQAAAQKVAGDTWTAIGKQLPPVTLD
jgi:carbon monoxide dehydrogenase subunit G